MATAELEARRPAAASEFFRLAVEQGARPELCAAGRWQCAMLLGDFEQAWQQSDAIAALGSEDPHRLWDGGPLQGRRVMLRCLHGYGDTIQFIRYADLIRKDAACLIVEAEAKIVPLLRRITAIDEVITWGENAPAISPQWDIQAELMELPRIFRTTLSTIPCLLPYISSQRDLVGKSARCRGNMQKLKIGLAWRSGLWNEARSLSLKELVPLLAATGAAFYSLQWEGSAEVEAACAAHPDASIIDLAKGEFSLEDAAAAISQLDLIVTVDTVVAHLAGALAKPVWTMLPFRADWRWMVDRCDSPWYPTMRLFRQPAPGQWGPVVGAIADALNKQIAQIAG